MKWLRCFHLPPIKWPVNAQRRLQLSQDSVAMMRFRRTTLIPVFDPDRFYRSREKFNLNPALNVRDALGSLAPGGEGRVTYKPVT